MTDLGPVLPDRGRPDRLADELQGRKGRDHSHLTAVAAEMRELGPRLPWAGESEPDGADGLLRSSPVGARDPGDGRAPRRSGRATGTLGHRSRHLLADGAVRAEQVGWNAKKALLELIRVGDETARGPARAAGNLGEKLAGKSAGAALRTADRLAPRYELLAERLGEGDAIGPVHVWAQRFAAGGFDPRQVFGRHPVVGGEGGERQMVLGELGPEPEAHFRMRLADRRDDLVEAALRDPEALEHAGAQRGVARGAGEPGQEQLFEDPVVLARDAGQEEERAAIDAQRERRGAPVGIAEHLGSGG